MKYAFAKTRLSTKDDELNVTKSKRLDLSLYSKAEQQTGATLKEFL